MKNGFRKDSSYWDRKLAAYLHDPPDKPIRIQGHEDRSAMLLEALGVQYSLSPDLYKQADIMASGMDRTKLLGYSRNKKDDGSVDFSRSPFLTHPTGNGPGLRLELPGDIDVKKTAEEIKLIIQEDLDGPEGICSRFRNDPDGLAAARFHYVHHVLRARLSEEYVGGLGAFWNRLPADTRIPDHSIWQHCGLVSALASCIEESEIGQASLVVFGIAPVQDFIERARKLRDFWTGSLILSWLAFEGTREIVYRFGSDHVLYPSLVGQPMIDQMLRKECGLQGVAWKKRDAVEKKECGLQGIARKTRDVVENKVASLPNKFVFLAPAGKEEETANAVESRIRNEWRNLGKIVFAHVVENRLCKQDEYVERQFERQMEGYFQFHWAACPFLEVSKRENVKKMLPESVWKGPFEFRDDAEKLSVGFRDRHLPYVATHALAQTFLAAGKTYRREPRTREDGIKCPLYGNLEILRYGADKGKNPRPEHDPFWSEFKANWGEKPDFKSKERLSSIALVKRIAGIVLEKEKITGHPLYPFFESGFRFPSTTEVALTDYLAKVEKGLPEMTATLGAHWKRILAQYQHQIDEDRETNETDSDEICELAPGQDKICEDIMEVMKNNGVSLDEADKYYAVLMMDGDKMGSLVAGETLHSKWESVIHEKLVEKMKEQMHGENYNLFWEKHLRDRRILAPSVHTAISEALGDFSLHAVPKIVEKYNGHLIYAGGDDACAFFPVSTVIQAAREISKAYTMGFVKFDDSHPAGIEIGDSVFPFRGRLGVHLGEGENISVSAAVLIAHHKRPLKGVVKRAHELLKSEAKENCGRNAIVVELAKRAGGSRLFSSKWHEKPLAGLAVGSTDKRTTVLDCFLDLAKELGKGEKSLLSSSLVYGLEELTPGIEALAKTCPEKIGTFLTKRISRSGGGRDDEKKEQIGKLAERVAALVVRKGEKDQVRIETEPLVIARFMGPLILNAERRMKADEKR